MASEAESRRRPERALLPLGLADLHGRAMDRLRSCLEVLDRQREAVRTLDAGRVTELAGLEAALTREAATLERTLKALERLVAEGPERAARVAAEKLGAERDALRGIVLERNRGNRLLLEEALRETRRSLAARRARLGAPSPFVTIGDAALVDIRT